MIAVLVPTDPETGLPPFELNHTGLEQWVASLDLSNPVDFGRYQYLLNCVAVGFEDSRQRKIRALWHGRNADTYVSYQQRVQDDVRLREAGPMGIGTPRVHTPAEERALRAIRIANYLRERYQSTLGSSRRAAQAQRDEWTVFRLAPMIAPGVLADLNARILGAPSPPTARAAALQRPLNADAVVGRLLNTPSAQLADMQRTIRSATYQPPPPQPQAPGAPPVPAPVPQGHLPANPAPHPLNPDQLRVFEALQPALLGSEPIGAVLLGPPGTGKSHLAKHLVATLPPGSYIVVAPTGKAAAPHEPGYTTNFAFGLGAQPGLSPFCSTLCLTLLGFHSGKTTLPPIRSAAKRAAIRQRFENVRVIIIEEVSMVPAPQLILCSRRLQQLFNSPLPFAGRHVICLGDPFQLEPIGVSLFTLIGDDRATGIFAEARDLFRTYRFFNLRQQMRALDPAHIELLNRLSDPIAHPSPITRTMLSGTCNHCRGPGGERVADPTDHAPGAPSCPQLCPHRCLHFKFLNQADVDADDTWRTSVKFLAPLNSTVDKYTVLAMVAYAQHNGLPIIRWRLPFQNQAEAETLTDEDAEEHPDLFGYYSNGAPCSLSRNVNTEIKFAHGTEAVLHSLVPDDLDELLQALRSGQYAAGDFITLRRPPRAVNVVIPTLRRRVDGLDHTEEGQPIIPVFDTPGGRTVSFGRDADGDVSVKVSDPGYKLSFGSTNHGVQGDTCGKVLPDFNLPAFGSTLSLESFYVAVSRVRLGSCLRLVPINPATGIAHLLAFTHDPQIVQFFSRLDENGVYRPGPPAPMPPPPRRAPRQRLPPVDPTNRPEQATVALVRTRTPRPLSEDQVAPTSSNPQPPSLRRSRDEAEMPEPPPERRVRARTDVPNLSAAVPSTNPPRRPREHTDLEDPRPTSRRRLEQSQPDGLLVQPGTAPNASPRLQNSLVGPPSLPQVHDRTPPSSQPRPAAIPPSLPPRVSTRPQPSVQLLPDLASLAASHARALTQSWIFIPALREWFFSGTAVHDPSSTASIAIIRPYFSDGLSWDEFVQQGSAVMARLFNQDLRRVISAELRPGLHMDATLQELLLGDSGAAAGTRVAWANQVAAVLAAAESDADDANYQQLHTLAQYLNMAILNFRRDHGIGWR